jgi:hypothetical protein
MGLDFATLDALRIHHPAWRLAHRSTWGSESDQVTRDMSRLTSAERALFDDLRDNRIRSNLRLEQEMIGFSFVEAAVARVGRSQ